MTEEKLFSRLVRVDALPREGQVVTIEATPAEREALASFYQASGHRRLDGDVAPRPLGQGWGARYRRCPRRTHSSSASFRLSRFRRPSTRTWTCGSRRRQRPIPDPRRPRTQRRFRSPTKTSPIPSSTEKSISALLRRSSSLSASIPIRASPTRSSMRNARIRSRRSRHLRRWLDGTKRDQIRARMLRAGGKLTALHKI